ncbi:hypothetical protein H8356DRAFT_1326729 [Neocallimastix lanati (nom. inval.)]|nr:hypothetical protein H8356DRAFT_1326729 [Neocallimastix sp. JGI-2020a]
MLRVDFNQLVLNKKYLIPTNNKFLVEYGADLIKENDKRETLLFHSCKKEEPLFAVFENRNESIIKYFLDLGFNKTSFFWGKNRNSTKPLFNACIKGYENIVRYLIKPEIVKYIVELEVDTNRRYLNGGTSLFEVCKSGTKYRADINIENWDKETLFFTENQADIK